MTRHHLKYILWLFMQCAFFVVARTNQRSAITGFAFASNRDVCTNQQSNFMPRQHHKLICTNQQPNFTVRNCSFHKRCVRSMCRVSLRHAFHHHISSATLFRGLNVMVLDTYYHNRILRWAGHVARMPMPRAPWQLLPGWVAHSRPNGCPEMTWGRNLKKALKCRGLPANFKERRAIAEDRSKWTSVDVCGRRSSCRLSGLGGRGGRAEPARGVW